MDTTLVVGADGASNASRSIGAVSVPEIVGGATAPTTSEIAAALRDASEEELMAIVAALPNDRLDTLHSYTLYESHARALGDTFAARDAREVALPFSEAA